ncbi:MULTISPECIES: Fur family transcriptional regulator [unclassified Actinobaculum]|uniref:Fur family transcriptional regulator n=1 Tax=unclassified Actinobaculum TaxID=2609299 RepID=UPI000D52A02C|nr:MULTISPECIES: Fur family transcriptional regulator [unclassified Actinobaculum]AWE42584.1 transcriptional repressor [Actinobaculum sp. 313]RTE48125.1 transcriptional repressor [Actinobaculum sp. 352]
MTEQPRRTAQRMAIQEEMARMPGFVSAQELHGRLVNSGQGIGLATVYRTLQSLADRGVLDVLRRDNETLYRHCVSEEHHHHLVCRQCGATVEVSGADVEAWALRVAAEAGFTNISHTLELDGICRDCTRANTVPTSTNDPAEKPSMQSNTRTTEERG